MGTSAETAATAREDGDDATVRPFVAVVVPFHGSADEAAELLSLLGALRLRPGDVAIVADNTEDAVVAGLDAPVGVQVLVTRVKRSAYAARNEAIEATEHEWILLLDADCRPIPDIADRFFEPPPTSRTGAVSGGVGGVTGQRGFVAAYARDRRHLDQEVLLREHVFRPMGVTANLLVRRAAWRDVGGFAELVRSGADGDFCWRLQDAGWELEHRAAAAAPHEHRADVPALLRKAARDGAANPWLARRWPGYPGRVGLVRQLVRAAGGVPVWLLRGRPRKAAFKAFDVLWTLSADAGSLAANAAPRALPSADGRVTTLVAELPLPGDPRLTALADGARVEGLRRPPVVQDWAGVRRLDASLVEDDGPLSRIVALLWLASRRPWAVARTVGRAPGQALELAAAARRLAACGGELAPGAGTEPAASVMCALAGARAAVPPSGDDPSTLRAK